MAILVRTSVSDAQAQILMNSDLIPIDARMMDLSSFSSDQIASLTDDNVIILCDNISDGAYDYEFDDRMSLKDWLSGDLNHISLITPTFPPEELIDIFQPLILDDDRIEVRNTINERPKGNKNSFSRTDLDDIVEDDEDLIKLEEVLS